MIITEENGISYELNQENHTAKTIKSYISKDDLLIPRSIQYQSQEFIITSIGEESFQENQTLKLISFPNNSAISIIGKNAFDSTIIESITIPDSVTHIEEYSFIWCKSLIAINISENSSLHTIGLRAFVDVPIQHLYFPSNLINLETGWCDRTSTLKNITVSPQNKNFKFINDQYLLGKSEIGNQTLNAFYFARRDITTIVIPSNITKIVSYAFDKCINLRSVEFCANSELQIIGSNAFRDCVSLKTIKIPSSVKIICSESFYNCFGLKTVNFGENSQLEKIGFNSFNRCPFEIFSIPSKVTEIESSAFSYCPHLKSVKFPEKSKLNSISRCTFTGSGLTGIIIPSYINNFGYSVFAECKKLKSAEFLAENLVFGDNFFNECDHLKAASFPNSSNVVFGCKTFDGVMDNCFVFCKKCTKIEFK